MGHNGGQWGTMDAQPKNKHGHGNQSYLQRNTPYSSRYLGHLLDYRLAAKELQRHALG